MMQERMEGIGCFERLVWVLVFIAFVHLHGLAWKCGLITPLKVFFLFLQGRFSCLLR